ncbi:MAG: hypothetical protein HYX68_03105 [Planctomycetes bacterium]|jgi:hypothetical protein|nr:hypothetical protein [Planctomycetota bacterium]
MNYELVFDAAEAGYRYWWFPAFGLIGLAVGFAFFIFGRKWAGVVVFGFALLWTTISFVGTFAEFWQMRQALHAGDFEVVEGKVVEFVPMPKSGRPHESFKVNGHRYEYSDFLISAAFNNTQSHGGPIREGLQVRIADIGGKIARLEIARWRKPLPRPTKTAS